MERIVKNVFNMIQMYNYLVYDKRLEFDNFSIKKIPFEEYLVELFNIEYTSTVEDINGHFDTGLLTSVLNKPLLLICGIAAILGGFYLRDSIRAITINVIFAILVHSVFPNGYISLLLIISGGVAAWS